MSIPSHPHQPSALTYHRHVMIILISFCRQHQLDLEWKEEGEEGPDPAAAAAALKMEWDARRLLLAADSQQVGLGLGFRVRLAADSADSRCVCRAGQEGQAFSIVFPFHRNCRRFRFGDRLMEVFHWEMIVCCSYGWCKTSVTVLHVSLDETAAGDAERRTNAFVLPGS
jgi:hypothetical protein